MKKLKSIIVFAVLIQLNSIAFSQSQTDSTLNKKIDSLIHEMDTINLAIDSLNIKLDKMLNKMDSLSLNIKQNLNDLMIKNIDSTLNSNIEKLDPSKKLRERSRIKKNIRFLIRKRKEFENSKKIDEQEQELEELKKELEKLKK